MNIVIVGGGTAGWISALILSSYQKNYHKVTVVASEEIGILGVGESTTAFFSSLVATDFFGIDRYEFFNETDSTLKLGVNLKNWNLSKKDFYSPIDGSFTKANNIDYCIAHAILNDLPIHNTSKCAYLCVNGLSDIRKISDKKNFICDNVHAVHIDTFKTGTFLKKKCIEKGVNYIEGKVENIILNDDGGIKNIKLSDGKEVFGDFFVDASGFNRVLSTAVGSKFISYKHHLPVNKAISFVKTRDSDVDFNPETTATALSSGWMWDIPTRDRNGMGYVFCDDYISEEEALDELKENGHNVNDYRLLKFESGRLDKLWNKNCLSVGVGGSFLEPLQATSIHTTIAQLLIFVDKYLSVAHKSTECEILVKRYNSEIINMIDDFRDLVSVHYSGGREDSLFWKDMTHGNRITEFAKDIIDLANTRVLFPADFKSYFGAAGYDIWYYILHGLGHIKKAVFEDFYSGFDLKSESQKYYAHHLDQMEKTKNLYFTNKELNNFFKN